MSDEQPSEGAATPQDARLARATRTYVRATAASFVVLYAGSFGFALFLAWWDAQQYPPFPTEGAWLGIRLTPALFLAPRLFAGLRALPTKSVATLAHLTWAGALVGSFVAAVAPAWAPFALLAWIAWGAGCVRDVLGLRLLARATDRQALARLAIAWAVHDGMWALFGRALFVEATLAALWPVVTALVLGVVTLRALRPALRTLTQ